MRIYIAGPLSSPYPHIMAGNVERAILAGIEAMRLGHSPYIPHLSYYLDRASGRGFDYETYMRVDSDWLRVCDALFYIGSSPGADREREFARSLGLTIYTGLEQILPLTNKADGL